ncbi:hypothetical protein [Cryobacterium sp. AP23]
MGAAHAPTPPSPANRRLRVLVGVLGGLLLVAIVLIVVLWPRPAATPTASDAPRPVPSSTPAPITPTPTTSLALGTPRPTDCEELYSPAMVEAFGNLVLNPDWLDNPDENLNIRPADEQLSELIDQNDSLECIWTTAEGGSDVGVATAVVWVDPDEREAAADRLDELGFDCFDEREGLRCTTEETTDEGFVGESHFLRDGIWLSTQYANAGPAGYTLDIVDNLWPDD